MADARESVTWLSLRDFRNFELLELDVPTEGFVVVGDNGQGKTNLLEAVYYLSLMRSVRGARDVDVTRFGADGFYVEANVRVPDDHVVSIGFQRLGRRKRVRRDGVALDRLSDALGVLAAVMFSPADVALIAGAPGERRRFLDILLALTSRGYLTALQQYRAALDRRNAALRDASRAGTKATASIEVWELPLAEHGAVLWRARRAWVAGAAPEFAERCAFIGEVGAIELRYHSALDPDDDVSVSLAAALSAKRSSDVRHGLTQVGPHRDDMLVLQDRRDLRTFGSAGQQRTAAIALRTLEADALHAARLTAPVFLLDDPFAELDVKRAQRVLGLLGEVGRGQTILAVPRDSDIPRELTGLPRMRAAGGRIESLSVA